MSDHDEFIYLSELFTKQGEELIALRKRVNEYEGENKRWHSHETVQAIVKERDNLREQLNEAMEALKKTRTLSNRQDADWDVLTVIWGCVDQALTKIEKVKNE